MALRPRSEKEIRERLFQKNFGRATVADTVSFLKEKNLIDDLKFARLWVESKMSRSPVGSRLLKRELAGKGVAGCLIERVLSDAKVDEGALAGTLAKERLRSLKGLPAEEAKRKLSGFLARRGFSFDAINGVIEEMNGAFYAK